MEVDWTRHYLDGYGCDAQRIFQRLVQGHTNQFFIDHALALLRTYLSTPSVLQQDQCAHERLVRLTWALHTPVHAAGYWDQICIIWPQMQAIAKQLPDPAHYVEITRQLAITTNDRGAGQVAQKLYEELIVSSYFSTITLDQQADLLHQLGVCYLDQGAYTQAHRMFERCLTVPETEDSASNTRAKTVDLQARIDQARCAAALVWESKAYAHNQLGSLALLRGDMGKAHHHFTETLNILTRRGEEDNLACVAYQALGRLLLIQKAYTSAQSLLEKNLVIRRQRNEKKGIAYAAAFLAHAYIGIGELAEAERLLNEGIIACRDLQDRRGLALCHLYFGYLEQAKGRRHEVLVQWRQAQKLAAAIPIPAVELQVLAPLWVELLRTGRFDEWVSTLLRLCGNIKQQKLGPMAASRLLKLYAG